MKSHQVLFCSVLPFIIIAAVSAVAITVFIDKISNHCKTNVHSITYVSPLILTTKQCTGEISDWGRAQTVTPGGKDI